MAEDPRFLLHFKTLAKFEEKLADGTVNEDRHLVFISDAKMIWCRGKYYADNTKLDEFNSYYNDWTLTLSDVNTVTITLKGKKWDSTERVWKDISKSLVLNNASGTIAGLMSAEDKRLLDIISTANFELTAPTTDANNIILHTKRTDVNSETNDIIDSETLTVRTLPAATLTKAGVMTAQDKLKEDRIDGTNYVISNPTTNTTSRIVKITGLNPNNNTEVSSLITLPAATQTEAGLLNTTDKLAVDNLRKLGSFTHVNDDNAFTRTATDVNLNFTCRSTDMVTTSDSTAHTPGIGAATLEKAGVMVATDKTKLDRITTTDFTLSTPTASTTTVTINATKKTPSTDVTSNNNVTIPAATTTTAGIISNVEKKKLNAITYKDAVSNVNTEGISEINFAAGHSDTAKIVSDSSTKDVTHIAVEINDNFGSDDDSTGSGGLFQVRGKNGSAEATDNVRFQVGKTVQAINKAGTALERVLTVTDLSDGSVTKVGTADVGSGTNPIYLSSGTPTASSSTVGSGTKPIYLNAGTITESSSTVGSGTKPVFLSSGAVTASTSTVGSSTKPVFLSSGTITAASTTVGSATRPVYMNAGTITQGTYTFGNADGNAAINNGTVNTNLNADKLDGKDDGDVTAYKLRISDTRSDVTATDELDKGITYHFKYNTTDGLDSGGTYHSVLHIQLWKDSSGGKSKLLGFGDDGYMYLRTGTPGSDWGNWGKVAFVTDNVASATQLQTSRNIALTGNVTGTASFNGTADASISTTISNNAVTTAKISDKNVTTAKLADNAVTTVKITNKNVTSDKLADNINLNGVPTAATADAGTDTTQIATTAFVLAAISKKLSDVDAMIYKGVVNKNADLPTPHEAGWTYKVATAGTYVGVTCEVGDLIICNTDSDTANNAHWDVVQTNINGAVTGPASATSGAVALFDGTTGKVIKNSATVGSATRPIYLNGGVPTQGTYTFGNASGNAPVSNGTLNTNLNADMLDGVHERNFAYSNDHITIKIGSSAAKITTALFITKLTELGAFNHREWSAKVDWSYSGNDTITDTGCGDILLAGCVIKVYKDRSWNSTNNTDTASDPYFIEVYTSPTVSALTGTSPIANAIFVYRNNGSGYSPKWTRLANTTDNVASASKLLTARSIALTGHVTGSANFDGSANISITTSDPRKKCTKITDLSKVPTDGDLCTCEIKANATLGLNGTLKVCEEVHVIIKNTGTSKITITIPATFVNTMNDPLEIEAGCYAELNVLSDGTSNYVRGIGT